MKRIDTSTRFADLFGSGKHGFRDGDRATSVLATQLNADWCNAIQEEIANAIEGAGIALNGADRSQLSKAFGARRAVFTSSGSWLCPIGVTQVMVSGCAGAGAGGGVVANARTAGAGGQAGGGAIRQIVTTVPGTVYSVIIGAGGTGVVGGNGNNGSATSLGALITFSGGFGGVAGTNDLGSQDVNFVSAPTNAGYGGAGMVGDIGGVVGRVAKGGDGGGSLFGAPVPGRSFIGGGVNGASGLQGTGFAQGGSGAVSTNVAGSALAGGNGTSGILILEW
jgi:hypothetical protein